MQTILRRFFALSLTAWLLLSSVGFVSTQSTCLFTGISQSSWSISKPIDNSHQTEFKRSTCFQFKHFQVKQQLAFSMKKQLAYSAIIPLLTCPVTSNYKPVDLLIVKAIDNSISLLGQSVRRAYLQVYLI